MSLAQKSKSPVTCLTPEELQSRQPNTTLIDIREENEIQTGLLQDAIWIPKDQLLQKISDHAKPEQPIVLYCAAGKRSHDAALTLQTAGYSQVFSLEGGIQNWKNKNLPIHIDSELTPKQFERFDRHLKLNGVGIHGQKKILNAKVLLVGLGGLGSPASLYLTAAGVGHLGLVDDDHVALSNLQRQILYCESEVGVSKVQAAKTHLQNRNPDIHIETFAKRLDANNAAELIKPYDIVVNGCDNYTTRYLLNDACFQQKKILVDAAIQEFHGRVMTFDFKNPETACYRCLYPSSPPSSPNCSEAGVLGVLPGIIGTLQATEVLKAILGWSEATHNTLSLFDAREHSFKTLRLKKNQSCSLCSKTERL